MDNEIVSLIMDGTEVKGKFISRTSRDIEVEITSPYKNLSTGLHIPSFRANKRYYNGKYGEIRAKDSLRELYGIGKDIEKILSIMIQTYLSIDKINSPFKINL